MERFQRRCPNCKQFGTLKEDGRKKGSYAICLSCKKRLRVFELFDVVEKIIVAVVPYNEKEYVKWRGVIRCLDVSVEQELMPVLRSTLGETYPLKLP